MCFGVLLTQILGFRSVPADEKCVITSLMTGNANQWKELNSVTCEMWVSAKKSTHYAGVFGSSLLIPDAGTWNAFMVSEIQRFSMDHFTVIE